MTRALPLVLMLLLAPALVSAAAPPAITSPCAPVPDAAGVDTTCAPIRPGARMANGCTLNFVLTDGERLYIGTAAHCVAFPMDLRVADAAGDFGDLAWRGSANDAALFRIDVEDESRVSPTMSRFGGPTSSEPKEPTYGEIVMHYGHGASAGTREETRARAGPVVFPNDDPLAEYPQFVYVSNADGGDSGSPVVLATGEAAGILVAAGPVLGYAPALLFATPMTRAIAEAEAALGVELTIVPGAPLVDA